MSIKKKAVSLAGAGALVGTTLAGVGVASLSPVAAAPAKVTQDSVKLSAPSSVKSGKKFKLKCAIKPSSSAKLWKGSTAVVHEKRVPVHASRVVSSKGSCSMNLILNAKGKKKISVVVLGTHGGSIASKWINIRVK